MPQLPLTRESVRELRAAATEAWAAAMGDATSCALAKDGRSYPAGKYHEGRVAALGELMRRLPPGTDAAAALGIARDLAAAWDARVPPGGAGNREWESYRAGGIAALEEMTAP